MKIKQSDINQTNQTTQQDNYLRYKFLFNSSPIPIHETNVTNISEAIIKLKDEGVERIEDYIEINPDFISKMFYDSDIFDVNDAMLSLTESDSKEYYIENFKLILGEPCFQFFQAVVIGLFYGRSSLSGQTQITTFKGNKIWIEATAMFSSMNGEEVINYTFKEITEKKQRDNAIQLINKRLVTGSFQEHLNNLVLALSEAFNLSHVFIGTLTADGEKIQTLAFSEHKEIIENIVYEAADSPCIEIYSNPRKIIYANDLDKIYSKNNTITTWGGKSYFGYPLFNKNGGIIGHFAFVNNQEIKNINVLQDIMELYASWASSELEHLNNQQILKEKAKTIAENLEELNQKNQKLEKYIESNMQLENFAYIASHDLKAPIRTIISFSQLLKRNLKGKLNEDGEEYLDFIISASRNMKDLIEDLLSYSKINSQPIQKESIVIENILMAISAEIRTIIHKKNAIINWNCSLIEISGDLIKLKQVFQNLITNGIKFHKSNVPPIINITCKEKPNHWQFSVEDNGIGIKPDYFERIFMLFQKIHLKNEYEGTGLGLAICKKIITQHKGEIWVESIVGEGTSFHFTIAK
jgi:signal transduction histidine kinase